MIASKYDDWDRNKCKKELLNDLEELVRTETRTWERSERQKLADEIRAEVNADLARASLADQRKLRQRIWKTLVLMRAPKETMQKFTLGAYDV